MEEEAAVASLAHTDQSFLNSQTSEENFAIPLESSIEVFDMAVPNSKCTFIRDFTHLRPPSLPIHLKGRELVAVLLLGSKAGDAVFTSRHGGRTVTG